VYLAENPESFCLVVFCCSTALSFEKHGNDRQINNESMVDFLNTNNPINKYKGN
jgi:hypothetical protein